MLLTNCPSVQKVDIDTLWLPADLPRRHPAGEIEKVRKLIAAHGHQILPVLSAPNGEILYWEAVWLALKANGGREIDVIVVPGKSPAELKALQIALNRIPLDAAWDRQNVRKLLQDLVDVEFDLELTGFDAPEIDAILAIDIPNANVEEDGTDIPSRQTQAVTSVGDIWELGKHRVGCGNALDSELISRLLDGKLASCAFVDPPAKNEPGLLPENSDSRQRRQSRASRRLSTSTYFAFFRGVLQILRQRSAPTAPIFVCTDRQRVMEMTVAGRACDLALENMCIWTRASSETGGFYRNAHEVVLVFMANSQRLRRNEELRRRGRNRIDVWTYPSITPSTNNGIAPAAEHRAEKPVVMIADVLRDVTKRDEIVLDTFLRVGSTLMAAHETGRICCGIDLDPISIDVAVRRWQIATGRDATLIGTQERFDDIAQRLLTANMQHGARIHE